MNKNSSVIRIKGARVHNLKNIDLEIPKGKLVVITGLSGSGKSSLAFDTIYAEGQRRYMESLSSYARQFLGNMEKPDVDLIEGLSPTIAIDQRAASNNPRSTVGTITEIYDYFRAIFAIIGRPHCPYCAKEISKDTPAGMAKRILELSMEFPVYIVAEAVKEHRGDPFTVLEELAKNGYRKVRINGKMMDITVAVDESYERSKTYSISAVFAPAITAGATKNGVLDMVRLALEFGDGVIFAVSEDGSREHRFSQNFACPQCGFLLPAIEGRSFSFNSPQGACAECTGLGTTISVDPVLVIANPKLTLAEGAIRAWSKLFVNQNGHMEELETFAARYKISMNDPVESLSDRDIKLILYGDAHFRGVIPYLEEKYRTTDSEYVRREIEKYMRVVVCKSCGGKRLKKEMLGVMVGGLSIGDLTHLPLEKLNTVLGGWISGVMSKESSALEKLSKKELDIAGAALVEVAKRVSSICEIGLYYVNLDRAGMTLSGGELQRLRLATQIHSLLVDVVYILDEPSIGLHQRDNDRLIDSLKKLRDLGNTVIVVEHDEATMRAADLVIDMGPGAGALGGEILAIGTAAEIEKSQRSLTGQYLSGELEMELPEKLRKGSGKTISVVGATANNLQNITVDIPLGKMVCVTGVSGSGKSTLIGDILARALSAHFYRAKEQPLAHKEIRGLDYIDKVINVDQSPIGRTPRSNPATYTGIFTYIRDLFVEIPESKIKGFKAGHFSFNVRGGRCETCQGDGMMQIGMQFLDDVYVPCEDCHGTRYSREALEVLYKGKNIAAILDMTVSEARKLFGDVPVLYHKLDTLYEVGLGYIRLGQSATTLSGGEAQRIKLATELSHRSTGKTLYILDEPTTGLHFEDTKRLLLLLGRLVDRGNTVLVIEHNLDVIKCADWIIDMGPEGGLRGGQVVGVGTPHDIAKIAASHTGKYLKQILK
ncbi:MAG: UvrABC system protein A [Parcubacteria group bacterium Gr01-1014_18]|nr:MAG: UvrABC system protein A [Parcubacteria group bacterium Greene0416_36]TSC80932.1 MAG: UvrABC system protein A [Parcubacteria group bacterium Gr01-1014_18]TSC98725.1 MAG: UvrABC system protein A [Parcubacteria group bacterium Greene1014_20]TSD06477.1 MAG: UvrABC system protein A [Parcubacteria group bacterium Greene0714_2]